MPTIAIIGASASRRKFGNKCVRAYLEEKYTVFPVNPSATEIEGLTVYPSIRDVPAGPLDRVSLYLPPSQVLALLPELAQRQIGEVWLNPGTESADVLNVAKQLGIRVITGCSIVNIGHSPSEYPDD